MKQHPRVPQVRKEKLDIEMAIHEAWEKTDLTVIELLQALNSFEASVLKHELRAERHPNNPEKPADVK